MRAMQVLAVAANGQVVPARAQMATTLGFHLILACFGIAFPTIVLVAEYRRLRRSDDVALLLARRWPQVLGVLAAVGADGVFATTKPGLLYIDMSMIRPDTAKRVAAAGHTAASDCLTSRSAAASREPSKGRSRSWWAETPPTSMPRGRRPTRSDRR